MSHAGGSLGVTVGEPKLGGNMSRIKWKNVEPEIDKLLLSGRNGSRVNRSYNQGYLRGLREGFLWTILGVMGIIITYFIIKNGI